MTVPKLAPLPGHQCWLHRSFQKDAKLRARERYWQNVSSHPFQHNPAASIAIIPEALVWRKYLFMIQSLLLNRQYCSEGSGPRMQWILLESAAELLDHRQQALPVAVAASRPAATPSHAAMTHRYREVAHSQERSLLRRLVRQRPSAVGVFCDLSVRSNNGRSDDGSVDEWDWLNYEQLALEERCSHALLRAARMILDLDQVERVWIVTCRDDQQAESSDCGRFDMMQVDDGMEIITMDELVHRLVQEDRLSTHDAETLLEQRDNCEKEYTLMNFPQPYSGCGSTSGKLSPEEIQSGLRGKQMFRGRLNVTKENPREAFVTVDDTQYFLDKQKGHFQHAFDGDIVIIQPLPREEWGSPVGRHRIVYYRDDDEEAGGTVRDVYPPVPSARIVAVEEPSRRIFIATMVKPPSASDSHILVVPMDIRIPKIRIHSKYWTNYVHKRLKIQVDGWEEGSTYPHGRCIEVVGDIGDLETELAALLLENQVDLEPFSAAALACLPLEGDAWTIDEEEIQRRRDLRHCRQIFSVDPPGCQDIDDTMHAMVLPNGDVEFGVHIADVTHLVPHESPLDKEAQMRGTTFYLVDRRFDMLPTLLSSNLCSLHGNADRLAVSVIWIMSSDLAEIKSTWYGRTVICNCAAMTYDQADRILRDQPPEGPKSPIPPALTAGAPVDRSQIKYLKPALELLTRLARKLRKDREIFGGAVDLSSGDVGNELKFTLVDGKPVKVIPKAEKEIHHTIAEMMILANTSVATRVYAHFPDSALLRIHRSVKEERFDDLKDILRAGNIKFEGKTNADVAQSLKAAQESVNSNPIVSSLFLSLATRAMSEAQYVSAGDMTKDGSDFSHYGLGLKYYTHFTSPIRRYADIVVHKQLLASLEQDSLRIPTTTISEKRALPALPESKYVSILRGEGLEKEIKEDEYFLDTLIEGTKKMVLELYDDNVAMDGCKQKKQVSYDQNRVSNICENLNLHNRLAKHSSLDCQRLFLSLYFRDNIEETVAVVVNLRVNGFWVYLPRFDIKLPVFLKDSVEQLQVNPQLLGLPLDSGDKASSGFAADSRIRRFADGHCNHVTGSDERIEISVPGGINFSIRPLDVVQVVVTCDRWDATARVPNPRVWLIGPATRGQNGADSKVQNIDSRLFLSPDTQSSKDPVCVGYGDSIFSIVTSFDVRPVVKEQQRLLQYEKITAIDREVSLPGRFVYGCFVNPDNRSAQQNIAQKNAAAESSRRLAQALAQASVRSEYNTLKQYEISATVRQQRLAADKRNARISKAKKGT